MRRKAAWQTWLIFVYLMSSFVKIPFFFFFKSGKLIKRWFQYAQYGVLTWKSKKSLCKTFLGSNFSSHIVVWNLWRSFSGKKTNQPTCLNLLTCVYIRVHIQYRKIKMAVFTVYLCWMAWSHFFSPNTLSALKSVDALVYKY